MLWVLLATSSALCAQAPAALWIDVPFVSQPRNGCGAASLAMVMRYWDGKRDTASTADSDAARIDEALYAPREHGIPAASMRQYLQDHGFNAISFRGSWSDIVEQIGKGRPLIVALRPQGQTALHYVVVGGFDPVQELVTMNDPADRKLLNEERARFEKDWSATDNWTLLAVPKKDASQAHR